MMFQFWQLTQRNYRQSDNAVKALLTTLISFVLLSSWVKQGEALQHLFDWS